ncbi:hypothetical protein CSC12_0947 [Klebsiella michiganensis]|nr:hypothetical protein A225_3063 [Klebsiella michiganensis E718]AWF52264.1 hypothetical protein CSC12_0947 [Klebsiella michiganensis]
MFIKQIILPSTRKQTKFFFISKLFIKKWNCAQLLDAYFVKHKSTRFAFLTAFMSFIFRRMAFLKK